MNRPFLIFLLVFLALPIVLNAQTTKTILIGKKRYIGHLDAFGFSLLTSKGDTVLNLPQESYFDFKFKDFNLDNFKDLYLEYSGNTPEKYSLFLYVPPQGNFKEIKNFSDYPDAKPVKGTKYYYSYSRGGCADNTWDSDLFYIKSSSSIKIGSIHGDGCGIKDGIYIYNVKDGRNILIKTLPLNTIKDYRDYKWGFLKQYWNNNYRQFL
jgi:hypothetical protein